MPAERVATPVREAATVVLLRSPKREASTRSAQVAAPQIYMVRRSARSTFMPDSLVFPGGRVEGVDLDGDGVADWPSPDSAFEAAARRECLEECAVNLTDRALRWFDTWLTPSGESPRRYLARFYFAQLEAHEGEEAQADGVETEDGRWASAHQHLQQWERGRIELPPPTLSILMRLADKGAASYASCSPDELRLPILPKVTSRDGDVSIVLPHDPQYGSTPGEGAKCPARSQWYPRRFVRRDERWTPQR